MKEVKGVAECCLGATRRVLLCAFLTLGSRSYASAVSADASSSSLAIISLIKLLTFAKGSSPFEDSACIAEVTRDASCDNSYPASERGTCECRNCSSSMASASSSLSKEQETSPNCFELHATVSASIHRRGFSRSSSASDVGHTASNHTRCTVDGNTRAKTCLSATADRS